MKLVVRAADYAMTDSITDGCIKAIRDGILTDVGLMTNNYIYAKRAVEKLKKYPNVSIGQDLNLVSGISVLDPQEIPYLTGGKGRFLTSVERKKGNLFNIPYDEAYREMKAQVERFIELVGRKPSYIAGHSLSTPEVDKAILDICKEYDIVWDCFNQENLRVGERWYFKNIIVDTNDRKPSYGLKEQSETDVVNHIIQNECLFDFNKDQYGMLATHCGYCDGELLNMSTFSVIRGRELEALCDSKVIQWIKDNNIKLINFDDFKKENGL